MSDTPPVLSSRSCGRIAKKIGNKFTALALELGFKNHDIQAFMVGQQKDLVGQNTAMLHDWVSIHGDKPDILERFLTALRAVGLNGFAKELEKRPDQEYGAPPPAPGGAPPPAPGGAASSSPAQPGQVTGIPNCLQSTSLDNFAKLLGSDGVRLGRALKFRDGELQVFADDNKNNKMEENRAMLASYIKANAKTDLVEKLVGALDKIGLSDLSMELERLAKSGGEFE